MKQWKKLAALLLAGVVALTVLTGCDGKTGAVVNGLKISGRSWKNLRKTGENGKKLLRGTGVCAIIVGNEW